LDDGVDRYLRIRYHRVALVRKHQSLSRLGSPQNRLMHDHSVCPCELRSPRARGHFEWSYSGNKRSTTKRIQGVQTSPHISTPPCTQLTLPWGQSHRAFLREGSGTCSNRMDLRISRAWDRRTNSRNEVLVFLEGPHGFIKLQDRYQSPIELAKGMTHHAGRGSAMTEGALRGC
jgi:hypothetical protein